MKTKLFIIFLLSFLTLTSINVFAQDSPNGSTPITPPFPDVVIPSDEWNTQGNTITSYLGSTFGTKNAYPIKIITNNVNRMIIDTLGNVGIGTLNPQAKLAVNGGILAKSVRINTNASYWPDYVFSSDYKLMSLEELENYIIENKHLPGIISAAEVEAQGDVNLGEMNAKLLEKIEELTLYIIDMQKQIEKQRIEIDKLKRE